MSDIATDMAKALVDAEQILDNVHYSEDDVKEVLRKLYLGNKMLMGTLKNRQEENSQVIVDMMSVVLAAEAYNDAADQYSSDLRGLGREARLRKDLGIALQKFRESETYAMMHKAPPSKLAERLEKLEKTVADILKQLRPPRKGGPR
jgi:tetrahydromethanopterin S-methyltransferase subunit B